MKFRVASIVLICAGIVFLTYPKISELYEDYQQQKLIREWQLSFQNIHSGDDDLSIMDELEQPVPNYSETERDGRILDEETDTTTGESEEIPQQTQIVDKNIEGMLYIDKIDLGLPILHGATEKNMKTTVASIENTGRAGEIGNYAIAGHRNTTFGRNFNRLEEMEEGDTIEVDVGEQVFEYTVMEKLYVLPEEVWVLEENGVDKEITLVTCHPMVNATHRLIIKGKIVE